MIVAITGATGFIGSRVVRLHLERGDTVRALSRGQMRGVSDAVTVHPGDLTCDSESLSRFADGANVLYHCAGEVRDPARMRAVHVVGTQRLVDAARGRIGHWVQLSSVGAYGPQMAGVVTEETPVNPLSEYEITKTASDEIVLQAANGGAFSCTILRPSNVYGPDMRNQSLFQLIAMINKRLFFFIGRPGASANYIHVDNVVDALYRCATHPAGRGRIYNLSDYRPLEQAVAVIASALGRPVPRLRLPESPVCLFVQLLGWLPYFPLKKSRVRALLNRVVYSTRRIELELGYAHRLSMEEGLRQLAMKWKMA